MIGPAHHRIEFRARNRLEPWMGHPGAIVAIRHFSQFVGAHLRQRFLVTSRIALDRDLRGHSAHRVHATAMARVDE